MLLKNHRYRMPAEWEKHARTFVSLAGPTNVVASGSI